MVHPVAGGTFLCAREGHIANLKVFVDEGVEVDATCQDVSSQDLRGAVMALECVLRLVEHGLIKEGDLTLEVFLVLEVTIANEAFSCDTFDRVRAMTRIIAPRFSVVAFEIVSGGYVEGEYFDLHYKGLWLFVKLWNGKFKIKNGKLKMYGFWFF